jgi:hypothetical protein
LVSSAELPTDGDLPRDPASVRFQSVAAILLNGIRRCAALEGVSDPISTQDEPVFGNLGDSLPEPLDFALARPLTVSKVSKTLGFGAEQEIQRGGNS